MQNEGSGRWATEAPKVFDRPCPLPIAAVPLRDVARRSGSCRAVRFVGVTPADTTQGATLATEVADEPAFDANEEGVLVLQLTGTADVQRQGQAEPDTISSFRTPPDTGHL